MRIDGATAVAVKGNGVGGHVGANPLGVEGGIAVDRGGGEVPEVGELGVGVPSDEFHAFARWVGGALHRIARRHDLRIDGATAVGVEGNAILDGERAQRKLVNVMEVRVSGGCHRHSVCSSVNGLLPGVVVQHGNGAQARVSAFEARGGNAVRAAVVNNAAVCREDEVARGEGSLADVRLRLKSRAGQRIASRLLVTFERNVNRCRPAADVRAVEPYAVYRVVNAAQEGVGLYQPAEGQLAAHRSGIRSVVGFSANGGAGNGDASWGDGKQGICVKIDGVVAVCRQGVLRNGVGSHLLAGQSVQLALEYGSRVLAVVVFPAVGCVGELGWVCAAVNLRLAAVGGNLQGGRGDGKQDARRKGDGVVCARRQVSLRNGVGSHLTARRSLQRAGEYFFRV